MTRSLARARFDLPFKLYDQPKGVGGWLLFFVLGQVVAILFCIARLPGTISYSVDSWPVVGEIEGYGPLVIVELLGQILIVAGGLGGLWLIFRKDPGTPRYYTIFLGLLAVYGIVDFLGLRMVGPGLASLLEAKGEVSADVSEQLWGSQVSALRMSGYALIWMLYWRSSQRVTNTFIWPHEDVPLTSTTSGG